MMAVSKRSIPAVRCERRRLDCKARSHGLTNSCLIIRLSYRNYRYRLPKSFPVITKIYMLVLRASYGSLISPSRNSLIVILYGLLSHYLIMRMKSLLIGRLQSNCSSKIKNFSVETPGFTSSCPQLQ